MQKEFGAKMSQELVKNQSKVRQKLGELEAKMKRFSSLANQKMI